MLGRIIKQMVNKSNETRTMDVLGKQYYSHRAVMGAASTAKQQRLKERQSVTEKLEGKVAYKVQDFSCLTQDRTKEIIEWKNSLNFEHMLLVFDEIYTIGHQASLKRITKEQAEYFSGINEHLKENAGNVMTKIYLIVSPREQYEAEEAFSSKGFCLTFEGDAVKVFENAETNRYWYIEDKGEN